MGTIRKWQQWLVMDEQNDVKQPVWSGIVKLSTKCSALANIGMGGNSENHFGIWNINISWMNNERYEPFYDKKLPLQSQTQPKYGSN